MRDYKRILLVIILALFLALPVFAQQAGTTVALWRDRGDVAALDLLDGPGGKDHQPGTNFKFIKESKSGTSPKFDVEDENGAKWKVKLGHEVKSETAATRLVWAAGYFTDEDYYRPQIHVARDETALPWAGVRLRGWPCPRGAFGAPRRREEIEELELVRKPLCRHAGVQRP